MPGFITHSLFAEEVYSDLKDKALKRQINKRMNLFYLGAQGPDLFFYYKVKPWKKYDGVEKLGFIMHYTKTQFFFIESLNYIKGLKYKNKDAYSELMVYIAGYICHFALDSITHPFIHYTAGIYTKKNNSTFKYHIYHKKLESIIDVIMLMLKEDKKASSFKSFKMIENISKYYGTLKDFYVSVVNKVYGIRLSSKQVKNVIGDIYNILKILYDPWNIKSWLFKLVENLYGRPEEITSSIHPRKINIQIDYLNQNHSIWTHPCDKDIRSGLSFLDLYGSALKEAERIIDISYNYINDKVPTSKIKEVIKNTSYSTGLECGTSKELKYFNSIFENPRFLDGK